jgi:hypothetical protein
MDEPTAREQAASRAVATDASTSRAADLDRYAGWGLWALPIWACSCSSAR